MEARLSFDDKHEIIYTYAADGRKLRAEYRINNFAVVDRDDEFGEMDDIGLPLSDVATFGLRDTMAAGGGIIDLPDVPPFTTLTTRDYCGNYIYRNGTLERILTPTGYIEGDTLHHYIKDYQGNVRCVVHHDGTLVESNEYYPYGGLFSATASAQPNKYGAKELDRTNGLDLYDSTARWYDSLLGRTTTMDPLAEKYYSLSPYLWCAGNPVKFVDPCGNAWKPIAKKEKDGNVKYLGFEWVKPELSYNKDGSVKDGLYEQAIVFTDNDTYDAKSNNNIGSSTAIVYKVDGNKEMFDASTMPSDPQKFATVPSGLYHAKVGKHQGKYDALRLFDTNNNRRIALGGKNPRHPERDYAEGINIHKAGINNYTGVTKNGSGVSEGCFLIDRNKWNDFINLFLNSSKQSVVGVILQRK